MKELYAFTYLSSRRHPHQMKEEIFFTKGDVQDGSIKLVDAEKVRGMSNVRVLLPDLVFLRDNNSSDCEWNYIGSCQCCYCLYNTQGCRTTLNACKVLRKRNDIAQHVVITPSYKYWRDDAAFINDIIRVYPAKCKEYSDADDSVMYDSRIVPHRFRKALAHSSKDLNDIALGVYEIFMPRKYHEKRFSNAINTLNWTVQYLENVGDKLPKKLRRKREDAYAVPDNLTSCAVSQFPVPISELERFKTDQLICAVIFWHRQFLKSKNYEMKLDKTSLAPSKVLSLYQTDFSTKDLEEMEQIGKARIFELLGLIVNPPTFIHLNESDIFSANGVIQFTIQICVPPGSTYAGETFNVHFACLWHFKMPPKVTFIDAPLHPLIYSNGRVKLSILHLLHWKNTTKFSQVISALLEMLSCVHKKHRPFDDVEYMRQHTIIEYGWLPLWNNDKETSTLILHKNDPPSTYTFTLAGEKRITYALHDCIWRSSLSSTEWVPATAWCILQLDRNSDTAVAHLLNTYHILRTLPLPNVLKCYELIENSECCRIMMISERVQTKVEYSFRVPEMATIANEVSAWTCALHHACINLLLRDFMPRIINCDNVLYSTNFVTCEKTVLLVDIVKRCELVKSTCSTSVQYLNCILRTQNLSSLAHVTYQCCIFYVESCCRITHYETPLFTHEDQCWNLIQEFLHFVENQEFPVSQDEIYTAFRNALEMKDEDKSPQECLEPSIRPGIVQTSFIALKETLYKINGLNIRTESTDASIRSFASAILNQFSSSLSSFIEKYRNDNSVAAEEESSSIAPHVHLDVEKMKMYFMEKPTIIKPASPPPASTAEHAPDDFMQWKPTRCIEWLAERLIETKEIYTKQFVLYFASEDFVVPVIFETWTVEFNAMSKQKCKLLQISNEISDLNLVMAFHEKQERRKFELDYKDDLFASDLEIMQGKEYGGIHTLVYIKKAFDHRFRFFILQALVLAENVTSTIQVKHVTLSETVCFQIALDSPPTSLFPRNIFFQKQFSLHIEMHKFAPAQMPIIRLACMSTPYSYNFGYLRLCELAECFNADFSILDICMYVMCVIGTASSTSMAPDDFLYDFISKPKLEYEQLIPVQPPAARNGKLFRFPFESTRFYASQLKRRVLMDGSAFSASVKLLSATKKSGHMTEKVMLRLYFTEHGCLLDDYFVHQIANMWMQFSHPNLMTCYGTACLEYFGGDCLIFEWMDTKLTNILRQRSPSIVQVTGWILGAYDAAEYLLKEGYEPYLSFDSVHVNRKHLEDILKITKIQKVAESSNIKHSILEFATNLLHFCNDVPDDYTTILQNNLADIAKYKRQICNRESSLLYTTQEIQTAEAEFDVIEKFHDLILTDLLGQDGHGVVRQAKQLETGKMFAVKFAKTEETSQFLLQEALHMRKLSHPCIIKCLGIYENPHSRTFGIVMEKCECSMLDMLQTKYFLYEVTFLIIRRWFAELISACECMHSLNIINRDIKPANILMRKCSLYEFSTLMSDLGTAVQTNAMLTDAIGTRYYMAPEVRLNLPYDASADVYSIGKTLDHIITRGTSNGMLAVRNVSDLKLNEIALRCTQEQARNRPKLKELIEELRFESGFMERLAEIDQHQKKQFA